ncbi:MAG: phosphatidate cytidylyltransferase [Planctomycetaceae bacterium]|nr:phosphatidate cytidylyltransferase [Planctomycetaceae bacterium]
MDTPTVCLFFGVLLLLTAATVGLRSLLKYTDFGVDPAVIETFRPRIRIWWILFGLFLAAFCFGPTTTTILFFILSVTILREYITLTPKSPADHQTLFWIYVVFTPLQFALVGINPAWFEQVTGFTPYRVFSLLLPGYVFLVLPGMMAISGDPKRFLERTAKLQLGLIVCVYSLSYAPALLTLDLPNGSPSTPPPSATVLEGGLEGTAIETAIEIFGESGESRETVAELHQEVPAEEADSYTPKLFRMFPLMSGKHFQLLLFFVLIVQLGDVFQYLCSRASRRHVVAGNINSTRTWGGVLFGMMATALMGMALWYFTPFPQWWQAGLAAMLVALMGFLGSMTMSAIKRDRGVGSYGALIPGHSGFLDRLDSLCFAAPVFYHFVWYFGK